MTGGCPKYISLCYKWVNSARIRITLLVGNAMAASRSGKGQTILLQIFNIICIAFHYTTDDGDKKIVLAIAKSPNIKFRTWIEFSQSIRTSETREQYSTVPPNHKPRPCLWLIFIDDDATTMLLSSAMPLSRQGHRIITVATIGIISLYLVPCLRGAYISSRCPNASFCFVAATEDREL
jgi:hypothetical protein